MRAALAAALTSAVPPLRAARALQLAARPAASPALYNAASRAMGQALSLLPPPLRPGRRGVAAAAKVSKAAIDRPGEEDPDLWMICGLGNPGPRYEDNRHNVGFMAVDALARQEGIAVDRLQETAAVGRGRLCGKKILLVKPMTFMNVSGEAVGKLARFYRIPAERVLAVYDDLDLATAAVRLRAKGGHGGHNGMKSIAAHLQGTKDFPRLRIGIGRPPGSMPVHAWVLQDFSKAEREEIDIAVQEAIDIIRSVLTLGMDKAVSGVRVDRNGAVIKPPHANGKKGSGGDGSATGSGKGQGGNAPAAKKQKRAVAAGEEGAATVEPTQQAAAAAAAQQPAMAAAEAR